MGMWSDFADYATRSDEPAQSTQIGTIDRRRLEEFYQNNPEARNQYEIQPEDLQVQEAGDIQSINLGPEGGTTTTNVVDATSEAAQDAFQAASGVPKWLPLAVVGVVVTVGAGAALWLLRPVLTIAAGLLGGN